MAASTQLITDMTTVSTTGPTAATAAKAIAPAGPIQDWAGQVQTCIIDLSDLKNKITLIIAATDAADPMLTTLNNVLLSLS